MKDVKKISACVIFSIIFVLFTAHAVFGETQAQSLEKLIEEKAAALREIEEQRKALEKELNQINLSSNQISKEIQGYNNNINQLNFVIKANKLAIDKLELEIRLTGSSIEEIESNIKNTKKSIAKLFTGLQQRENDSLLAIFLRNGNLSDSVSEAEYILRLNSDLGINLQNLRELQENLRGKLTEEEVKKTTKEREQINLSNRQVILQDQKTDMQKVLNEVQKKGEIYEEQIEELQKIQFEISAEIEKIETELRKNINPNLLPLARPGVLEWPVPSGRVTQGYGATPFAIRNYSGKHHNGIDIGLYLGAEIVSAEKGVVINTGNQDLYCPRAAYGKFVVVKHENGLTTLYGHMSRFTVSVGDKVERGELIGYMGKTGWATGPHLHFSAFATNTLTPARPGLPEGTISSRSCGPMPVGGDIDPAQFF